MSFLAETQEDVIIKGITGAHKKVAALEQVFVATAQIERFCNTLIDTIMGERGVAVALGVTYKSKEKAYVVRFTKAECDVYKVQVPIEYDFGKKVFLDRFVETVGIWLQEYVEYLRTKSLADKLNVMVSELLQDADLTYTVAWQVGTGIMYLDDNNIVFGADREALDVYIEYINQHKHSDSFREYFADTFKLCVTPIELLKVMNEITCFLGIYQRYSIYKRIHSVHNKRFETTNRGTAILRTAEYVTVIDTHAATESEIKGLPADLYCICKNVHPLAKEVRNKQDYLIYRYVIKPIGAYCMPVNIELATIINEYKPLSVGC